jgi:hypothetical protein
MEVGIKFLVSVHRMTRDYTDIVIEAGSEHKITVIAEDTVWGCKQGNLDWKSKSNGCWTEVTGVKELP